jgi:hypothetical protein
VGYCFELPKKIIGLEKERRYDGTKDGSTWSECPSIGIFRVLTVSDFFFLSLCSREGTRWTRWIKNSKYLFFTSCSEDHTCSIMHSHACIVHSLCYFHSIPIPFFAHPAKYSFFGSSSLEQE